LYEWNYQRQLLHLKLEEHSDKSVEEKENTIFGQNFLLKRPLLEAITHDKAPVLLIDELDRADEEFESFLLEILSDWQITVPEIGTIAATHIPSVIITSNRTRELSDAVRRRCLYLWIDYPSFDKELAIVRSKINGIDEHLADQICTFMQDLREVRLEKTPGIAETLDWAAALVSLHRDKLDLDIIRDTIGVICKNRDDVDMIRDKFLPRIEAEGKLAN
jgi:MoxR-like ATPase